MRKFSALPYFLAVLSFLFFADGYGQATLPVNTTTISKTSLPTGFSHSGLGADYSGPKLKFDDQGDYLVLRFNTYPGSLTFDIGVNNNFGTTIPADASFSVLESTNGIAYTAVASYSNTATGTKTITTLNAASRYVKWIYTLKPSGSNIALYNINIVIGSPPCSAEPTSQATDISYTDNSSTSVDVDWIAGAGGDEYILVAREASSINFTPTDGVDYSGDTGGESFASATNLGTGNKVVYTGSATATTVTGLTTGSTYYFQVFAVCTGDTFNYLTSTGSGNLGTLGYAVPALIPDNGCGTSNYLESTFEYTGGSIIGDINVFVAITHTYRADLRIELESPNGTVVQLLNGSTGLGADNLEVNFDDEAGSSISTSNHIINGIADQTVISITDPLSDFDGEDPNGIWILRICDDAGSDTGFLNDWTLDITIAIIELEPTDHPTDFNCEGVEIDEIYIEWTDVSSTPTPSGYLILWSDLSYASITPPVDGTPIADGAGSLNVAQDNEIAAINGLATNTDYFFKIYPYSNSGADIAYKTDGTVRFTSCNTLDGPCINEGFNNYLSEPSGWNYNGLGTYNTASSSGISIPSIKFDDSGDRMTTSISTNPASEVSFWLKGQSITGSSALLVEGYNGSIWTTIENIVPISNSPTVYTYNASSSPALPTNLVQFRFTYTKSAGNIAFDDLEVLCTSECSPTHIIAGFSPHEGPDGTLVTITGSGFTGATDVRIGGNSVTFLPVEDDNIIHVLIDDIPTSGLISVIVSDCEAKSTDSFTYLNSNESCSGSSGSGGGYATDIFISEVYDASSGSLSYIELFNGTASAINLTTGNYSIVVETGATSTYILSGSVGIGNTHILRLGGGASLCPDFTIQDDRPGAPGYNGNDEIFLYKNGVPIDYAPNPNSIGAGGTGSSAPGFSQSRNVNVVSPTTTYNASNWTISNTEDCENLSVAPYVPGGKNIIINTHPADVDCDELTFSVAATTNISPNVPTTYTWRYIAPGDITWSLVSTLGGTNGLVVTAANFPSITITGNTSQLLDYQFYVDMGTGGTGECRKFSNAASYTFDTKAYYRTVSGGNWSNLDIWEMSNTEGGTYEQVCQYPIDRTSDKITIQNGHNVTFDVELTADWIDICPTCTLELLSNTKLTLLDGNASGPDLIVNGTLIDNGNLANGIDFLDEIPTWEIGAAGTLIKTSSSYATRYRNAYHNGIANIPATATWIYRYTNNGNLSFASSTAAITMHYPNLILENTTLVNYSSQINNSDVFLSNFTMVGNEPIIIKGDFDIGGSETGNIDFSNLITNTSPVRVDGELLVRLGSTLRNTGINAPVSGTGLEVQGDLNIEGALDLTSGIGAAVGILKLSGDQDMIGLGGTTISANNLIINKGTGFNILADLSFDVKREIQFINGILELTEPANTVILSQGIAITGAPGNDSHIDGFVSKSGTEDFSFPVGDAGYYQPIGISDLSESSTFRARYIADVHPDAGPYYDGNAGGNGFLEELGHCDYWTLNRTSGSASANVTLTYGNTPCNVITDLSYLNMAKWDGLSWEYPVVGVDPLIPGEISSTTPFPTFSDFVLASTGGAQINVLPIQLTSFTAKPENYKVQTAWTTETETNNAFFTVERSADARVFQGIGEVTGAGTSHTPKDYTFTDEKPLPGVSYYRLKQTDFDGIFTHSAIKAVSFTETDGFSLELTYRDENELNLVYKSISPYILVEIFDVLGKRVFTEVAENYGGRSVVPLNLNRGVYVVRISNGKASDSAKTIW
ncbi:T9SS type A sorting domain-containing protein [Cryomorpha ignava]|uniref:T9SS type A sorting domain-containing protein n=1 Tax=Cryomorpha ignava TaxID=101383 RepID=A0A7K3WVM6_9FLAO|nr:proprotein convertase P-domain-containing protein [Cryomorpha ignava]NEN25720.1 T9SS type A sorting domain-containing protein [Cryomorpha ignava]